MSMMELRFFKSKTLVLISFYLVCTFSGTNGQLGSYPTFYFHANVVQCKLDSPELFYNKVALPSVTNLLEEGKIFFGVLMDRLESSLADAEKFESLEKEWLYLLNVITESFDLAIRRIESGWDAVIDHADTSFLPWELRLSNLVLIDFLHNLSQEYQVVEAVVRAGTKELMTTLQGYLLEIMEKLEQSIFDSEEGEPKTEMEVIRRMEKAVNKLEPTFIGALVKKILGKARRRQNDAISTITFLKEPMNEIAITVEAYRTVGQEFPTFWSDMTNILKVNGSYKSPEELFNRYMTDDDFTIDSVVTLLSTDLVS